MDQTCEIEQRPLWPKAAIAWVVLMGLTLAGVVWIETYGPLLLWRDQVDSAWHLKREAAQILEAAPYGSPGRMEALHKVEVLYRRAVEDSPTVAQYRINLANTLEELGQYEEAYSLAKEVLPAWDPHSSEAVGYAGHLALVLLKLDEAETLLKKAVEINPKNPAYREDLAKALFKQGRLDEGIAIWKKRFEDLPATPEDRVVAGWEAARAGRYKESAEWFAGPAELGVLGGEDWLVLAVTRAVSGDEAGAVDALARHRREQYREFPELPDPSALGLQPLDPEAQARLAAAHQRCLESFSH